MEQINISYFAKTKPEAIDFADRIDKISGMIYQNGFNLDTALMEIIGIQKKDKFISLLRDNKVQIGSVAPLKEFLTQVKETALSLPVLAVSLAFEPNAQTLQLLSEWFLLNIKKQVLFGITIDPKMIAGIAISYQGRYMDFSIQPSFLKIVDELLHPKKEAAPPAEQVKQPIYHNPDNMHV